MADHNDATQALNLGPGPEDLSPLEAEVLEEYERLADNMKKVHCPNNFQTTPLPPQTASFCPQILTKDTACSNPR